MEHQEGDIVLIDFFTFDMEHKHVVGTVAPDPTSSEFLQRTGPSSVVIRIVAEDKSFYWVDTRSVINITR
jgi:hypothetical protein